MLTQAQNQTARQQNADFTTEATAYKALLKSHDLPLSVDLHQLTTIYRGRLFDVLLPADTGLQARYSMVRTPEGQRQFRAETVASIDLRGHELVEEVTEALQDLERAYDRLQFPNDVFQPKSLGHLASGWNLDLGQLFDQYTMNWEGKEHVRAYFEQLGVALTQWRTLMRALNRDTDTLAHTMENLSYFFPSQSSKDGAVVVDEQKLYSQLQYNPQLLEVLTGPPVSQAA